MAFAMITSHFDNPFRYSFPTPHETNHSDDFMLGWVAKKTNKIKNDIKQTHWNNNEKGSP